MADITVKVVRVPGTVTEVVLNAGATVGDALSAAGTSLGTNEALKVNGNAATAATCLTDGARVYISQGAKGN